MIIDFHTHVFPPEMIAARERIMQSEPWFSSLYGNPRARMATADELVAEMDACGVDISVACGFAFGSLELCEQANSYVAEAAARYSGRLVGFASVPLGHPDAGRELERALALGLRGIGELAPDGQEFDLDDVEGLAPLADFAREHGLPVLAHASEPVGHDYPGKGTCFPEKAYRLARAFPQLKLVLAHWGGGLPFYELMPEVRESLAGVSYDCAASPYLYDQRVFPVVLQMVGSGKIVFGSDFPLISPRRYLAELAGLGLAKEDYTAITGGNAAALLGIER